MTSSSLPDFTTNFEMFEKRHSWTMFSKALELAKQPTSDAVAWTPMPIKLNFIATFGTEGSTFFSEVEVFFAQLPRNGFYVGSGLKYLDSQLLY